MRKPGLIFAFLFALTVVLAAQTSSNPDVFTINVAAPASSQDVQVRYILSGDPALQQGGSIARPDSNRIVIETAVAGKSAKGFRAIVYSSGCQFVTITAELTNGAPRQADFQCQKLSTTPLHGRATVSSFAGKDLQVEALYNVHWAAQFFGVPGLSISPISLGKAKVADDGSFALDLPDFAADRSWSSLSHNATLTLVLLDASNGERLARLSGPRDLSRGSSLKIAASYPSEINFIVK
jgi:hypothetical protein